MRLIDECVETYEGVKQLTGDPLQAMQVTLRLYASARNGNVVRRPLRAVIDCVCEHFGVTMQALLGGQGDRRVRLAVRVAMWIYRPASESWTELAKAFGRNRHTDAMRKVACVDKSDRELAIAREIAAKVDQRISAERGTALVALPGERGAA